MCIPLSCPQGKLKTKLCKNMKLGYSIKEDEHADNHTKVGLMSSF